MDYNVLLYVPVCLTVFTTNMKLTATNKSNKYIEFRQFLVIEYEENGIEWSSNVLHFFN